MSIKYTDEELIHILQRYAKQLGRTPTTCDIIVMGGPSRNAYYRHFGKSWADVLEVVGLPPVERASLHEKYIHKDTPTREQVIDAFTSFVDDYGYMPPKIDYPDFYRESRKIFKSDDDLIEACGFNSTTVIANTEEERQIRVHTPIEYSICQAVKKATPGTGFSCEFIRRYMKGDFE